MKNGAGIFAGVKVLELGAGAAGPVATRYFADHGAMVVRIESARRPDFLRILHLKGDDPHDLDGAPMFVLMNPNKLSVTVDMNAAGGIDVVKRLVGWADVVSENFSPKAMAKWGLGYETLRQINPGVVGVSNSLFGQTGPQRLYPGFGGQGSAIAGFNHLTGWPDREAVGPYGTITDSLSPRYVALLVAAALLERRRSGEGCFIDVSQIETGVYSLSEMSVRYSANGEVVTRCGNRCERAAPHGIYPCRGEDRWIAIAVFDDGAWRDLVSVVRDADWARDPRFATAAGRLAEQDELDARLGDWTRQHEAEELMERLQAAGVEAGSVQSFADLNRDPQLAHRGHFESASHVHLGELRFEHSGLRFSEAEARIRSPGPNLGEHNDHVLREILGYTEEEIAELSEREILV